MTLAIIFHLVPDFQARLFRPLLFHLLFVLNSFPINVEECRHKENWRRMAVQLALKQLEWKFDRTPNLCLNPPSEQPDRKHCSSQLLSTLLLRLTISPALPAGSHSLQILSFFTWPRSLRIPPTFPAGLHSSFLASWLNS